MKISLRFIFFILLSVSGTGISFSQTLGEIEEKADELFEDKKFLDAGKLYLKVISDRERIKDHTLNFKYGTCLLFFKGEKKQEAIAYLKRSVKNPSIDVRAFYYLGKAYHYNYQFDLAQKYYEKFNQQAAPNEKKKFDVLTDIRASKNGKKLLSNVTNMIVINKTQVKSQNFYELYKLQNIGGSILRYDRFQSKYDKKVGHIPLIHLPKGSPFIYFSSYGSNGETGLDIYVVKKLPNNEWSQAQKVNGGVNTAQDEDFPYLSPDKRFLYFSSKGHNSMGGYDVFRSRFLEDDNTYLAPDNLDFAISSPDDDLFYIVDSLDRTAYFTSARESELGKLTVYHARVEKIPIKTAMVKGKFINTIDNSNKNIEIIVSKTSSGKEIGTFKSSARKGSYLITFPQSGKYTFIMTVDGEEISHQATINIPYLKEFRPLKMTISHLADANQENYLKVEQQFDDKFENPTAILAEVFKEISKLKPNAAKFDIDSLNRIGQVNEIFVEAGLDSYSTKEDVEKVVDGRIKDLEKLVKDNEKNSTVAYHLAEEKFNASNELLKEIDELIASAKGERVEAKRKAILQAAYSKTEKAVKQKEIANNYLELAKSIDEENNKIKGDIVAAKKVLLDIKSTDNTDRVALGNVIHSKQDFFNEQIRNGKSETKTDQIIISGLAKKKELDKHNAELIRLNKALKNLENENNEARISSDQTKKKKLKEKYAKVIIENEGEMELILSAVKANRKKIEQLSKQNDNIELTGLAQEINDPIYAVNTYTKTVSSSEKVEIKTNLKSADLKYAEIQKVFKDNNIKAQKIGLSGLNESRTDLTAKEWGEAIEREIKAQEDKLAHSNSADEKSKVQDEIKRLKVLKVEKTEKRHLEAVAAVKQNILDNYESISKENSNNTIDQKIAQNKFLTEAMSTVDGEIEELNTILEEDPSNSNVIQSVKELEALKKELSSKINESGSDYSDASPEIDVESDYPEFSTKTRQVNTSNASPTEKAKESIALNTQLISKIDEEIEALKIYEATKPSNETDISNRIDALVKLKAEKTNENRKLSTVEDVAEGGEDSNPSFNPFANLKTTVNEMDIMPSYDSRKTAIANSEKLDNLKAIDEIKLNEELNSKIEDELTELENYLKTQPSNKTDVLKRIENLNTLKQDKLKENKLSQERIDSIPESGEESTILADVMPDYTTREKEINSSNLSDSEINSELNQLNKETLSKINERIKENEEELSEDVNNEELDSNLDKLNALKKQITLELIESTAELTTSNSNVEEDELLPNYTEEKELIANSKASASVKAKEISDLNTELISTIDAEIEILNSSLKSNPPNKKVIEKRIKNLEKLKSTTEKENETHQDTLEENGGSSDIAEEAVSIDNIKSDFQAKETKNNAIENEMLKSFAQNELIEETLKRIETQVATLESNLETDPSNELIPNQLAEFSEFKENITAKLDENAMDLESLSAEVSIDDLVSNYTEEKEFITNSKATEGLKATRHLELNVELISKIEIELAALQAYFETNPPNKKVIEKRIKNLEKLKTTTERENETHQDTLEENGGSSDIAEKAVSIDNIRSDFEAKEAQNNAIENEMLKAFTQNELIEETLTRIETQVATLESNLETDPSNELIPNQLAEFSEFKENITAKLDENAMDLESLSVEVSTDDLVSNYTEEKELITNSKATEDVKATRHLALNAELISKIEMEQATLQAYLETSPPNKKVIEKRIKNLEKLKTATEKENETHQDTLEENGGSPDIAKEAVSIDNIRSDFEAKETKNNAIENEMLKAFTQNELIEETLKRIENQMATLESNFATDPSNELIPNQLAEFSEFKENITAKLDENAMDLESLSAEVSTDDLVSNYAEEKELITNSKATEDVKATRHLALNTELISKIEMEQAALQAYLETNPPNKKVIEKRIKNLEKLKSTIEKENERHKKNLESKPKQLVGSISVGDLIPGFKTKMDDIENNDDSNADKAKAKNKLNTELLSKIDSKLEELNELKETNPDYVAKMDTLKQLRAEIVEELDRSNEEIKSDSEGENQSRSVEIAELNVDDFPTAEGKEKMQDLEGDINDLQDIKTEIETLEANKLNQDSEKSIQKIDKKITKLKVKQAKVENEIIEELAIVNANQIANELSEVTTNEEDLKYANFTEKEKEENLRQKEEINSKIEQAKQLRQAAEVSKDPIEANNNYKEALALENEAKIEMEAILVTYETTKIANDLNSSEVVLSTIESNVEKRESTRLFEQANELEDQAFYYEDKANRLRDSAQTVKRKYRDAILINVQKLENKANELSVKAEEKKKEAIAIQAQEDELLRLIPVHAVTTVQGEEKDRMLETIVYKSYFETKAKADEDIEKVKALENKIADLKVKSKRKIRMAVVVGGDTESISDDEEIKRIQEEIDALTKQQVEFKARALENYTKANSILSESELSDDTKINMIALTHLNELPKEKPVEIYNPRLADFEAPKKLDQDIFRTTEVPTYKSTKEIPVDAELPTGLVYKVQIGAFRKEPSKKYFERFAPVSGESLNNGITRFMVGYFTNYTPANTAKKKVRGMGDYKDAFVVAYYNGKRISIGKARSLEKENAVKESNTIELISENKVEKTTLENSESQSPIPTVDKVKESKVAIVKDENQNINVIPTSASDKAKAAYYTNSPNAVKANQVEIMKGLFFTVQIGVYSKPVSASALFNIVPVNSQLTPSNKIRYTSGVYNSVEETSSRKNQIREKGIKDAFVTAYYNGERITVSKAKLILSEKGPSVLFLNQIDSE